MAPPITPKAGIDRIKLYKGGEATLAGFDDVLKLSSNENPFGAPDSAKQAIRRAVATLHRYPSTDHLRLRRAIGEVHGLNPDRIVCGVGSDEILALAAQAYAPPGTEVIHTAHGFSLYKTLALAAGAEPVEVPERERRVDVGLILEAVTERTRLVYLTNPGNPTATMLSEEEIARLADGLPEHVLLIIDGAYAEFAPDFDGGAALAGTRDNVLMTRTFSKLYGLGGLRVGWAYGAPHIIDTLNRIRGPFNLSDVQLDGAEAAMRDRRWAATCLAENARMRDWLRAALEDLGIPSDPSFTNFVLARFASEAEADAADRALRADGIIVRQVKGYKLPDCLRITVGTEADCRRVVDTLRRFRERAA